MAVTPNLFQLGTIWKNEIFHAPAYMQDPSGNPKTGLVLGNLLVKLANQGQSVLTTVTPDAWTELGQGLYDLQIASGNQSVEGRYVLEVSGAGAILFDGAGCVEQRPEARVLGAIIANYETAGSAGEAIAKGGNQYKCFATPSYNYSTQTLEVVSWLQLNGQLVACVSPDTSRVVVKEDGTTVRADTVGVTPTGGDGFFVATLTSIVLNALKNHSVIVSVTHLGVTYTSGESYFTWA